VRNGLGTVRRVPIRERFEKGLHQVSTETTLRHMHPVANSAGWLLSPAVEFDGLVDWTDRLIGLLAVRARHGDPEAVAEISDLHRRVRGLDSSDKDAVRVFAEEIARRATELAE
jgi:hypothetical protein